ncbi:MAG TPA: hypothetical protein VEA99_05820 [Gemmatimonadaceae bacterium]|nr:hypothetical protein [Gemmatimonadaceae bacterium]
MPRFRATDYPSLDELAFAWAARQGISIAVHAPQGAQRALEIALDAMPPGRRPAFVHWRTLRKRHCLHTGTADPRCHVRQQGFWAKWLAKRGLAVGDRLTPLQLEALRQPLEGIACRFHGIVTLPNQEVWRRRGWAGMNNTAKALVITRLKGEALLDVVATRTREAMRERTRAANRVRYQSKTPDERAALIRHMRRRRVEARKEARRCAKAYANPRHGKPQNPAETSR